MVSPLVAFVRQRLHEMDVSAATLARRAGVNASTVSRWMTGKCEIHPKYADRLAVALASPIWPESDQEVAVLRTIQRHGLDGLRALPDSDVPIEAVVRMRDALTGLLDRGRRDPDGLLDLDTITLARAAKARWTPPPGGFSERLEGFIEQAVTSERDIAKSILRRHAHGEFSTHNGHFALLKEVVRQPGHHEIRAACTARDARWWVSTPGLQLMDVMARTSSIRTERVFALGWSPIADRITSCVMQVQAELGVRAMPLTDVDLSDGTQRNLMVFDGQLATQGNGATFYWTIDPSRIAQIREAFDRMLVRTDPHAICPDTIRFDDLTLERSQVRHREPRDAFLRGLRERLDRA